MKFLQVATLLLCLIISWYLLLPDPGFPPPPPGSLVSTEPADTESIYRRAYFTDLSRQEIMEYYSSTFALRFLPWVQLRLNNPPEESQTVIRDQALTSWLEELVHPWRESVYINGFYPTLPTQAINVAGKHYEAKITVRLLPSHPVTRLTVLAMTSIITAVLFKEFTHV
ncbi:hypothetical protein A2701_02075 [Candidatus Amesbacteria bacterium RIFCSPHIGHO2_01_FULL_47_34]|uniref:Uncharacterized protein n=2 Tax=Candidatus Amesiibacteriota TaxID=1752730 RepID=A0A0G1UUF3_9BACT|nr:MAG: hypothetical protein UY28_C0013G0019 [Candidatus Amesbacteria bacterium GW2011_GWB1_48_13]OGC99172.1 MAG: hypothetical protein A2701_02075 [Candidatus Amesbacteria bacterium RIFCSPHIGHO2_01_FULL_47_34]OGD00939.1 MAG: hypothetical protein A2972_03145 [Candidatus Amesbacteria bacterium RIFCSPLOWO2_01_FULL_47_33]